MQLSDELEELRVALERIRTLLENLTVRGLRACGPDELLQIASFAEHLDQTGASHLAGLLADLQRQIERDDRASARTLLETQTNVRLLERLLTLRVVKGRYTAAMADPESSAELDEIPAEDDEDDDPEV